MIASCVSGPLCCIFSCVLLLFAQGLGPLAEANDISYRCDAAMALRPYYKIEAPRVTFAPGCIIERGPSTVQLALHIDAEQQYMKAKNATGHISISGSGAVFHVAIDFMYRRLPQGLKDVSYHVSFTNCTFYIFPNQPSFFAGPLPPNTSITFANNTIIMNYLDAKDLNVTSLSTNDTLEVNFLILKALRMSGPDASFSLSNNSIKLRYPALAGAAANGAPTSGILVSTFSAFIQAQSLSLERGATISIRSNKFEYDNNRDPSAVALSSPSPTPSLIFYTFLIPDKNEFLLSGQGTGFFFEFNGIELITRNTNGNAPPLTLHYYLLDIESKFRLSAGAWFSISHNSILMNTFQDNQHADNSLANATCIFNLVRGIFEEGYRHPAVDGHRGLRASIILRSNGTMLISNNSISLDMPAHFVDLVSLEEDTAVAIVDGGRFAMEYNRITASYGFKTFTSSLNFFSLYSSAVTVTDTSELACRGNYLALSRRPDMPHVGFFFFLSHSSRLDLNAGGRFTIEENRVVARISRAAASGSLFSFISIHQPTDTEPAGHYAMRAAGGTLQVRRNDIDLADSAMAAGTSLAFIHINAPVLLAGASSALAIEDNNVSLTGVSADSIQLLSLTFDQFRESHRYITAPVAAQPLLPELPQSHSAEPFVLSGSVNASVLVRGRAKVHIIHNIIRLAGVSLRAAHMLSLADDAALAVLSGAEMALSYNRVEGGCVDAAGPCQAAGLSIRGASMIISNASVKHLSNRLSITNTTSVLWLQLGNAGNLFLLGSSFFEVGDNAISVGNGEGSSGIHGAMLADHANSSHFIAVLDGTLVPYVWADNRVIARVPGDTLLFQFSGRSYLVYGSAPTPLVVLRNNTLLHGGRTGGAARLLRVGPLLQGSEQNDASLAIAAVGNTITVSDGLAGSAAFIHWASSAGHLTLNDSNMALIGNTLELNTSTSSTGAPLLAVEGAGPDPFSGLTSTGATLVLCNSTYRYNNRAVRTTVNYENFGHAAPYNNMTNTSFLDAVMRAGAASGVFKIAGCKSLSPLAMLQWPDHQVYDYYPMPWDTTTGTPSTDTNADINTNTNTSTSNSHTSNNNNGHNAISSTSNATGNITTLANYNKSMAAAHRIEIIETPLLQGSLGQITTTGAVTSIIASSAAVDFQVVAVFSSTRCFRASPPEESVIRALSPTALLLSDVEPCAGAIYGAALAIGLTFVLSLLMAVLLRQLDVASSFAFAAALAHFPSLTFVVWTYLLNGLLLCTSLTNQAGAAILGGLLIVGIILLQPAIARWVAHRRLFGVSYSVSSGYKAFALRSWATRWCLPVAVFDPRIPVTAMFRSVVMPWRWRGALWPLMVYASVLCLTPITFADGALCLPMHIVSIILFCLAAMLNIFLHPYRIPLKNWFAALALLINAAFVAVYMALLSNPNDPATVRAHHALTYLQAAFSAVRILLDVFSTVTLYLLGGSPRRGLPLCCFCASPEQYCRISRGGMLWEHVPDHMRSFIAVEDEAAKVADGDDETLPDLGSIYHEMSTFENEQKGLLLVPEASRSSLFLSHDSSLAFDLAHAPNNRNVYSAGRVNEASYSQDNDDDNSDTANYSNPAASPFYRKDRPTRITVRQGNNASDNRHPDYNPTDITSNDSINNDDESNKDEFDTSFFSNHVLEASASDSTAASSDADDALSFDSL